MIRINYPKHPYMLQVNLACLTCLKRFHSADIFQLPFSSERETITRCSCSCHPITAALLCSHDMLITWDGEDLSEIQAVDFSPSS